MQPFFSGNSFSANYFDRLRGEACAAEVRVQPGVIFIFLKKTPAGQTLEWLLDDLQSARQHDDGSVILQNGKQFLEITTPGFRAELDRCFPKNKLFRQGFFDKIGVAGCLVSLLLVLLPLIGVYKWLLPGLADSAAQKVSPEIEKNIGDSWFKALTANQLKLEDKTRLAQQFYDSLGFGGAYDIRITVLDEPVLNAFAVPGGNIVLYDSLLAIMETPEELAGLLAHEASHVQLKHSTRAIFRELANSLFFSMLLGNYGDVSAIVVEQADQLGGLAYSRELEFEADANGLLLLEKSGIPPQGIPSLFKKMTAAVAKAELGDVPTFLSTHPSMEERIQVAEEKISKMEKRNFEVRPGLSDLFKRLKIN